MVVVLATTRVRYRYLLLHPTFTGAVAVLAVNDHLLKGHAPGWLTGKLSDLAGVFVLTIVLSVVTGRPRLAAALTGVGFLAIKISMDAAEWVAPIIGGVTRQDPTDLLALAVLWPAYSLAARSVGQGRGSPTASRASVRGFGGGRSLFDDCNELQSRPRRQGIRRRRQLAVCANR